LSQRHRVNYNNIQNKQVKYQLLPKKIPINHTKETFTISRVQSYKQVMSILGFRIKCMADRV
jgi:hypothetical protein